MSYLLPLLFGITLFSLCTYWDRTEQQHQKRKRTKQAHKQAHTPLDKTVTKQ